MALESVMPALLTDPCQRPTRRFTPPDAERQRPHLGLPFDAASDLGTTRYRATTSSVSITSSPSTSDRRLRVATATQA